MSKFQIIGCAPGLAFGLLLDTGLGWALGRLLTILLLNLPPLLLWPGDHLVHGSFGGGVYTYAYDMRNHKWVATLK